MSIKSIFLSLSFVMISAFATASGEVVPAEASATTVLVLEACTVDATFTSGGTSVSVSVTADDCGTAYATLGAIARAMDE